MESAIKTVVTTFLGSAKGKENLDGGSFQKLVKKQLGGMMEVRNVLASNIRNGFMRMRT